MKSPRNKSGHRGWLMFEMIAAMFILTILAGVLIVTARRERDAQAALAASRASARAAEAVLTDMQSGKPAPTDAQGVRVLPLDLAADTPLMQWVEVDVTIDGRSATLVGLVPRATLGGHI